MKPTLVSQEASQGAGRRWSLSLASNPHLTWGAGVHQARQLQAWLRHPAPPSTPSEGRGEQG